MSEAGRVLGDGGREGYEEEDLRVTISMRRSVMKERPRGCGSWKEKWREEEGTGRRKRVS